MQTKATRRVVPIIVALVFWITFNSVVHSQHQELMMRRSPTVTEVEGGLDTLKDTRQIGSPAYEKPAEKEAPTGLAVPILFDYDSAALRPDAMAQLDIYGKALTMDKYKNDRWGLEGHTDASGSDAYNLGLSQRRAKSVYNYLVESHGVRPDQLVPSGKGETELLEPSNPYSEVNRRVRITYLGG